MRYPDLTVINPAFLHENEKRGFVDGTLIAIIYPCSFVLLTFVLLTSL